MQNLILLEGPLIHTITIVIVGMISAWPFDELYPGNWLLRHAGGIDDYSNVSNSRTEQQNLYEQWLIFPQKKTI
jgi:hypothetical protein